MACPEYIIISKMNNRVFAEGNSMTLKELKEGQRCIVKKVGGEGALRQHFLDMGIIPGAEITIVKFDGTEKKLKNILIKE